MLRPVLLCMLRRRSRVECAWVYTDGVLLLCSLTEKPLDWRSYRCLPLLSEACFVYAWRTFLLIACNSNGNNVWLLNDTWNQDCVTQRKWCNLNGVVLLKNARVSLMFCRLSTSLGISFNWRWDGETVQLQLRPAASKAPYTWILCPVSWLIWNILWLCGLCMTAVSGWESFQGASPSSTPSSFLVYTTNISIPEKSPSSITLVSLICDMRRWANLAGWEPFSSFGCHCAHTLMWPWVYRSSPGEKETIVQCSHIFSLFHIKAVSQSWSQTFDFLKTKRSVNFLRIHRVIWSISSMNQSVAKYKLSFSHWPRRQIAQREAKSRALICHVTRIWNELN